MRLHEADRHSLAVAGLGMPARRPRDVYEMADRLVSAVRRLGTVDRNSMIRACRDYGYSDGTVNQIVRFVGPRLSFDGAEYHPRRH